MFGDCPCDGQTGKTKKLQKVRASFARNDKVLTLTNKQQFQANVRKKRMLREGINKQRERMNECEECGEENMNECGCMK